MPRHKHSGEKAWWRKAAEFRVAGKQRRGAVPERKEPETNYRPQRSCFHDPVRHIEKYALIIP